MLSAARQGYTLQFSILSPYKSGKPRLPWRGEAAVSLRGIARNNFARHIQMRVRARYANTAQAESSVLAANKTRNRESRARPIEKSSRSPEQSEELCFLAG